MNIFKTAAVVLGTALIWHMPAYGAKSKRLPQPFPFGTQRPVSMTYLVFIDGQPYEDYTVAFEYNDDGNLRFGEYDYGPNRGLVHYQYEDGALVSREEMSTENKIYFLYDAEGRIYAADHELKSEEDGKEEHDIIYHYDPAGRLSYAEEMVQYNVSESSKVEATSLYARFNYSLNEYIEWQKEQNRTGKV